MQRTSIFSLVGLMAFAACTNEGLVPVPPPDPGKLDNRVSLSGDFCTTDPDTLRYPVKVMFVVDGSSSLNAVDPPDINGYTQRLTAMEDAYVDSLQGQNGVEVSILTFGAATRVLTNRCDNYVSRTNCHEGFTSDEGEILTSILAAGGSISGGNTNYAAVLSVVYSTLFDDMSRLKAEDEEAAGNARYVVIFFTDGLGALSVGNLNVMCPYDSDHCGTTVATCPENYGRDETPHMHCSLYSQLDQIMMLRRIHRIRSLEFHSMLFSAGITDEQVYTAAGLFMGFLADIGGATYRDFENGEDINFLNIDFSSYKRQFKLHNFVVSNLSARPWSAAHMVDSDYDGLDDVTERLQGSDPFKLDTDGDGFNDLLEHQLRNSGRDPIDPSDASCDLEVDRRDDDFDGLRNCEERVAGSFSKKFDSDFDGIPDLVEHRFNTYLTLDDLLSDGDFDGSPNGDEIRWHSDPHTNDSAHLSEEGYRYRVVHTGVSGNQLCYHYDVDNVRLVTTNAPEGEEIGWNKLGIFITEVPLDEPDGVATFQMGCARARFIEADRFKLPASGDLEIPTENLWRPNISATAHHEELCVVP